VSRRSLTIAAVIFISSFILASQLKPAQAPLTIITVTTDKSVYNVGETVLIRGNLTFNNAPVSGALVALQVNDRVLPYIFRTLYTGSTPPSGPWKLEITNVYIGDSMGNPVNSVKRGSNCYIWIYYQNISNETLNVSIAFTIYDVNQVPLFAEIPFTYSVPPGKDYFVSYVWNVPSDAALGNATLYVSAFRAFPEDGGTPHCPEKSKEFTITASTATATQICTNQSIRILSTEGSYDSSFRFPKKGATRLGNYTIYVASYYIFKATSTTKFEVILLGDIYIDGGTGQIAKVDGKDYILLIKAIGSYPGHPNWNPRADLNKDGVVDGKDFVLIIKNIGNTAIY